MDMRTGVVCLFFIVFFQGTIWGQFQFGIEAGTSLSTTNSFSYEYLAKPKIGTRAGFNVSYDLQHFFSIRSGVFYSLRGSRGIDLHTLNIPVLAVFNPTKKLSVGLGLETNVFLRSNMPTNYYPLTLGVRAEVAWKLSSKVQLIAHFAHDLTPHHKAYGVYDVRHSTLKPFSAPIKHYNVAGGLSLAYSFYQCSR